MDISIYKSGITAIVITLICTPIFIYISKKKGFYALVNHRSSHDVSIPNTGGIVLCMAVLTSLILFSDYPNQEEFSLLISAFAILLITGIIDDFNPIPVAYKFLGQFIPAIVIVAFINEKELVIPFLHDIIQLPYIFNYLFWILFIVMTINAFNLIDGIDGLAIGLGIVGSLFYFIIYVNYPEPNLAIFSISLSAGLFALFFFNISSKMKIFLGDTGSLMIGALLVYFALKFISLTSAASINYSFFLVLGSIFLPLADMIRVILVRLFNGSSPFQADNRHIHHVILDLLKGNHLFTTGILIISQIGILMLFRFYANTGLTMYLPIIILTFLAYCAVAFFLNRRRDYKTD